ncbi:hypothetical protein HU200_061018 [Digitaria exilis]|uniref:Protein kinase domain-containing protein n=1 Tax=Digitaria exilis TaxID=1010633 RepID=A0A835A9A0_9POAL|nr:hypothetical protein HU200_061018 [Digitaria exilis]
MKDALLLLVFIIYPAMVVSATSSGPAISLPGCPNKCGNVSIPYPFGIGDGCAATSHNRYFSLICNNSFQPPIPMFGDPSAAAEVIDISLEHGEVRLYDDISYDCFISNTTISDDLNYGGLILDSTPFIPSTRNRFLVIGCSALGIVQGYTPDPYVAGCYSYCEAIESTSDGAPCAGKGCCETAIPPNLTDFETSLNNYSSVWQFNPCFYAMIVEEGWYNFSKQDLQGHQGFMKEKASRGVPVVNDWAIRDGSCPKDGTKAPQDYACVSSNSYCVNANNGPGMGTRYDGTNSGCRPVLSKAELVVIGLSASAVLVVSLACLVVMKLQRSKYKKERDEYFKQNGGLKLYDEMRSRQVDTIHILTEKEIKKATNNFSEDRVLGCGGHGMVYRGTLDDDKEVAIKKSKVIDDDCREEFVNEIIILSQINHRNIVRLLGCCLEVDVPMLIYEFISNGTLFEFLHGYDHKSTIPLDLRLKIATQSAEALAYIHSSTSRTILHGDVKSLNILLDDDYNAKVSDFGASALKSMDKNDFIMLIQGTLGYIDPESFVSHHLTDKSDVYSFGVVLLELMTRKKAIYIDTSNEKKSLSHTFMLMFHQNEFQQILDSEIVDDEVMVVLEKLCQLVMHCLSPSGDERPTMKEVAERLQMLRRLQMQLVTKTYNIQTHHSNKGRSVSDPSDETGYQSTETAKLVLEVDLAR